MILAIFFLSSCIIIMIVCFNNMISDLYCLLRYYLKLYKFSVSHLYPCDLSILNILIVWTYWYFLPFLILFILSTQSRHFFLIQKKWDLNFGQPKSLIINCETGNLIITLVMMRMKVLLYCLHTGHIPPSEFIYQYMLKLVTSNGDLVGWLQWLVHVHYQLASAS